jgi:hypothetical protein
MTTITSSTTIGITLSSASYVSPIVVDPGVTVANGQSAVYAASGVWTLQNNGTISSTDRDGVYLKAGGSVTNAASGSITGLRAGVYALTGPATIINNGVIKGDEYGAGVDRTSLQPQIP